MIKRTFDITVAAVALIILAPVFAAVALLLWWVQGAVFFCQGRPGLHGRLFTIYKFRSMNNACDEKGLLLPDDQRITRLGRIVRKLSLDELPQLWNVLKGEMSLVGPRPLLVEYLNRYSPEQARRHNVKPGITGWAQVNGRNALTWEQKFALDIWYVDHSSFGLDLKILALTFWHVLRRDGISREHHATMPVFMGREQSLRDKPSYPDGSKHLFASESGLNSRPQATSSARRSTIPSGPEL